MTIGRHRVQGCTRALPCYDAFLQDIQHFNDCEKVGLAGLAGILGAAYCKIRIVTEATEAFCKCIESTYDRPCQ